MKKTLLGNPFIILLGAAAGVFAGLYNQKLTVFLNVDNSQFLKILSLLTELYIFILQISAIPVIICAVTCGFGRLVLAKKGAKIISRLVFVFIVFMAISAACGMGLGFFGQPGLGFDGENGVFFSKLVSLYGTDGAGGISEVILGSGESAQLQSAQRSFNFIIPPVIVIAVLLFSVIMGAAIGVLQEESALLLIKVFTSFLNAFQKLISWIFYFFPFFLICFFTVNIAAFDIQLFKVMSKFIILFITGTASILIICVIIILMRCRNSKAFLNLVSLFEPVLFVFSARSELAALPVAVKYFEKKPEFNSAIVNFSLPAGITLGRFGNIFFFALSAFFTAQIYGVILTPSHYLLIFASAILAGCAAAGMPGILALSMLGIVLKPLNLPLEAVLIIFIAADPVISPFRNLFNIYVNMAASALIVKKEKKQGQSGTEKNKEKNTSSKKQLLIFIQEMQNKVPLLNRVNGLPCGLEISYINEIGKRMNRQVIFKDSLNMTLQEIESAKMKADIIAGVITKGLISVPPPGFYLSRTWTTINKNGIKINLCFMLRKQGGNEIDEIIQTLDKEDFFKYLLKSITLK
ncbi:MAG: dicarboxylate/amino acid:cation symporter [Treponema sp.]|nr:dicarboxylate/amino acid:cation symporter [Treponema sp.]